MSLLLAISRFSTDVGHAADMASEFSTTNEGWVSISHTNANPPLNLPLQLQVSTDLQLWKKLGPVFIGDGKQQSRCYRVADQSGVFFRLERNP